MNTAFQPWILALTLALAMLARGAEVEWQWARSKKGPSGSRSMAG